MEPAILTSTDRATAVEWGKKSHPWFLVLDAIVENPQNQAMTEMYDKSWQLI